MRPPFSFCKKKMRRARWKRKTLFCLRKRLPAENFSRSVGRGHSLAVVDTSQPATNYADTYGCMTTPLISLSAAAAPALGVGFQRKGPQPLPLCRFKGRSRRGKSKSPSWCVFWTVHGPFSPQGENGGCIAQPSPWLNITVDGKRVRLKKFRRNQPVQSGQTTAVPEALVHNSDIRAD